MNELEARFGLAAPPSLSYALSNSPDPPYRRTSEEAYVRGRGSVRADRRCRTRDNRKWGDCPQRRHSVARIVVLGDPELKRSVPDRVRPAAAGLRTHSD